jgi:hypothetical protein
LRPGYFADDLVDTQRLGTAAAERCQHVLQAVFLARLGFGESNRRHHEAAITAYASAVERASGFGDAWVQSAALSTRARAFTTQGSLARHRWISAAPWSWMSNAVTGAASPCGSLFPK